MSDVPPLVRSRLALALDVDDVVVARRLARELKPVFGVAKIGLELFGAGGPDAVATLANDGFTVFLDLKLHDIPTTVGRAARVFGALGVGYLTMHAAGGTDMLRAGVAGLREGAAGAGLLPPVALAVTVLTSEREAPPAVLRERVVAASAAGCGGVVCAGADLPEVRSLAPSLVTVVPGIRPEGASTHDQRRPVTVGAAVRAGASVLVVGRAVTAAADPLDVALAIARELELALPAAGAGGETLAR